MKNVNEDIPPIDIEIEDSQRYGQIAILVDRDDFRKDIVAGRKKLGITSIPYTFPTYPYEAANSYVEFYKEKESDIYETVEHLEDFCNKKGLSMSILDAILEGSIQYTQSLAKKYQKNSYYFPVILDSILTGAVHKEDFLPTLVLTQTEMEQIVKEAQNDLPFVAIRVTPESTPEEVQRAFSGIMSDYFGRREIKGEDGITRYKYNARYRTPDFSENIKRDRKWYWLKKGGLSYQDICKAHAETNKTHITLRGIELAIKRYSDNLL